MLGTAKILDAKTHQLTDDMTIYRALPKRDLPSVGPFVFFDHFHPDHTDESTISAHPHAGIEIITYLIEGHMLHRDSLGHHGSVESGGAQYILSGQGLIHEERVGHPDNPYLHGVQLWLREPTSLDEQTGLYLNYNASELPYVSNPSFDARLVSGSLPSIFATPSPLRTASNGTVMHILLHANQAMQLDTSKLMEFGLYQLSGSSIVNERIALKEHQLYVYQAPSIILANESETTVDLLLIGGDHIPQQLHFCGNFVYDSYEDCNAAYLRYEHGEMGHLAD
ncbi:MAG: pirin family protein [Erysipelotrichaceae bacterium]